MNRLVQLDALRAFAVLGVIAHHSIKWDANFPLGPYCVRLFFVLSGYLITGILLRAREKSRDLNSGNTLRAFYVRRFLRIFPIYYLSLAVLYLLGQPDIRETLTWHVSYLSNVLSAQADREIKPVWGHLWSLSVEEQFYLVWPAFVLFLPRRWLPYAFLSAAAVGPIFRGVVGTWVGVKPALYLTPGCLDSLALGAFLAWLAADSQRDALRDRLSKFALVAGLMLTVMTAVFLQIGIGWRLCLATRDLGPALVFCWLINGAAGGFHGFSGRLLELRPLAYIGTISYAMYLLHNFIPWLCEFASVPLPPHGIGRFILLVTITTGMAAVSWAIYEKPLNDLKDRFPYVRVAQQIAIHAESKTINASQSGAGEVIGQLSASKS